MGIPFYYKTIITKYPHVVERTHPECTHLFIDFNSIIHQAAASIAETEKTEERIFNAIVNDHLKTIVNALNPKQLVYLAIDGLCPMAKMHQQRKRRYMTVWRNKQLGLQENWDTNCITPGTCFMNNLDDFLQNFIKTNNYTSWLLSGSKEEGEGEHKIFEYIANNLASASNSCHCPYNIIIHGMDADLIMLSMISMSRYPNCNITLIRDDTVVNIQALMHSLQEEYKISIETYIVICVLFGNDFLPPLSYLKIKNNDIDKLAKYAAATTATRLVVNSKLNLDAMRELLATLQVNEDNNMQEACDIYYSSKAGNPKFMSPEERLNVYPLFNKFQNIITPLNDPTWRLTYYLVLFPSRTSIADICENYIHGLFWVVDYYFNYKNSSKTWFYKYNFSPTVLDLCNNLSVTQILGSPEQDTVIHKSLKGNSDLQLLMVLPPSSVKLLQSEKARKIMTDVNQCCSHYYPTEFEIVTFLKQYLWECIPILPDIDIKSISLKL